MRTQGRPVLDLPDAKTPEDWEAVLARLNGDRAAGEAELGGIEAERRSLALASVTGDPAAVERIAALNQRQAEVGRGLDLLAVAQDAAKERLAGALADRARAAAAVRRGEAATVAHALVAQSERADAAFAELTAALSARAALARKLAGYGGVSINHLLNRTRLLAAATEAGLDGVLEIGRAPRHLSAPLRQIDRTLLRDLLPAAEAGEEPERPPDPRALPGQVGQAAYGSPAVPVAAAAPDPSVRW